MSKRDKKVKLTPSKRRKLFAEGKYAWQRVFLKRFKKDEQGNWIGWTNPTPLYDPMFTNKMRMADKAARRLRIKQGLVS